MYKLKLFITAVVSMLSAFVAQSQTPGGINNPNYTWQVWLTPDSYDHTSGIWTNQIMSTGSVGNFYAPVIRPSKVDQGYNFHPSVEFTKTSNTDASKRLVTSGNVTITPGQNVTSIFVYKRANTTRYDFLFSFNDGNTNGDLAFYENDNNNLRLYWASSNRNTVLTAYEGMIAVDNSNSTSSTVVSYLNGVQQTSTNLGTNSGIAFIANYNSPWTIGAYGNSNSGYGFEGVIQEIIILKATGAGNHMEANDLQKIHSYLALKYGIGMETQNYVASNGAVTWNINANTGYNKYVFGIGRDDSTRLYQKESVSTSNNQTTLFLGNTLETLNSKNTATLGDRQFLVLGSNGVTTLQAANIANGDVYSNGNINAREGLNFQSGVIYKAQLTNLPAITVSLKLKMDYKYVLVSKDASFVPSQTKIYPVNINKTATIDIDTEYKYIRYAGFSPGPGGLNTNLVLWLHADNEESLDIQNLPLSDARLNAYPYPVTNNEAPAVQSWTDPLRGQTYSWSAGGTAAAHRIPVYEPDNLMMNFHPSVRFWGSGTNYGSYLSNAKGILSTSHPANNQHTAYFVTSNNFSTNDWIYAMMFGSVNTGQYNGPGYGVQKLPNGNLVGRFRTSDTEVTGATNLFNIGATSINGYYQNGTAIKFRFNGKDDNGSPAMSWGNFNMSAPSMLGPGFTYNRTLMGIMAEVIIFEKALSTDERRQLESYLAIKYGTTLRPSNTATNRFDYVLSNGKTFWRGNVNTSDPVYGKYASFYNNIAAVIRDDAARLNNRQSHSTDAGSILHMGVAGKKLGSQFEVSDLAYDEEVIAWGSNDKAGVVNVVSEPCADFESIFKKIWMVHKQTEGDRPITMLVGAENNRGNNLGSSVSSGDSAMYAALEAGVNDLRMIVADSPEKLTPGDPGYGNFKAVVPMSYVDDEHQCAYTFSDSITYITFGYKPNRTGCAGDVQFTNTKTYNWNTQWARQTYNLNGQGGAKTISKPTVNLDDSVTVTTKIVYDNVVRANNGYPRFTSNPRNALNIQRRYGTVGVSKVITTIMFDTPVIPDFYITGIDSRSRQYDQVTISATCPKGAVAPVMMYAGDANTATYVIQGNKATGNKNRSASNTSVNGRLNVTFRSGITTLTIEYLLQGRVTSGAQDIFISPLTLRSVPPPPVVNEDGISFTKRVGASEITTCEPVEYTFRIGNSNTDGAKYINFKDVLPEKMTWQAGSVAFDASIPDNPDIVFNNYGGTNTLEIDKLLVPCSGETIFKATANFDEDAPSNTYANRAVIGYTQEINNTFYPRTLASNDEDTQDSLTVIEAVHTERKDTLQLKATVSPGKYDADDVITVTLNLINPNTEDIPDMYLDVNWNASFSYVAGSYISAANSIVTNTSDETSMTIAGMLNGSSGFVLPSGETAFMFKLRAPDNAHLEFEPDDQGVPTSKKAMLDISCELSIGNDNPCISKSLINLEGTVSVPHIGTKSQIIVNKHTTAKPVK